MSVITQPTGHVADDITHEPEEPPDETFLSPNFTKAAPKRNIFTRRVSLLTKQLHASEGESNNEDELHQDRCRFGRAPSASSMADLTSDNDVTSPGTRGSSTSPPLPSTRTNFVPPHMEKHNITIEPAIAEKDEAAPRVDVNEKAVESGLGRRRCITFACGRKAEETKQPARTDVKLHVELTPKRKCAITFACPTRVKATTEKPTTGTRHMSPGPRSPYRSPRATRAVMHHRGSESTVTGPSPSELRKVPSVIRRRDKYLDAADEDRLEAERFHEFAVDTNADEEWTEEATCHRKRMTVQDTLQKENAIRKMAEEAEEEAEDEDELDDEAILDELDDDEDDLDNDEIDNEDAREGARYMPQAGDTISDGGFDTDDEGGFANSEDDEEDDSDFEWWAPGRSTAATSTDALELIRPSHHRKMSDSSLESAREANGATIKAQKKSRTRTAAVKINRPSTPELPDSTDFVCGTLDEDRPLEQAYLSAIEQRRTAKHKPVPQDIDPTFPTSDIEMDEEDEEDDIEQPDDEEDDGAVFLHGHMDVADDRGRRAGHQRKRTPNQSPRRLRSPPPASKTAHRSPPMPSRRSSVRSPPPPCNRGRLRSPPPRKLFGHSPHRLRSPPPSHRPTSPPNSRSSSVQVTPKPGLRARNTGLSTRSQLTQTASLPRVPTMTNVQAVAAESQIDDDEYDNGADMHSRGAIDIVKGLEKKRQRRKEKLYQKHYQKHLKEGEKRCKPGRGAERMREIGLELAAYRGNRAQHMLSY